MSPGSQRVHCAINVGQSALWTIFARQRFVEFISIHHYATTHTVVYKVIQELGREGILPYSSIFASNKPFGAPFSGLFIQYLVSCTFLLAVPPGDVYLFLISREHTVRFVWSLLISSHPVSSYSTSLVNALVAFGLLLLYTKSYRSWEWNPPFRAPKLIIVVFFISNIFLIAVPFIPPTSGSKTYEKLPYWVRGL